MDTIYHNWFEIGYWDSYVAEGNELEFRGPHLDQAGTYKFEVSNFTTHDVEIFDITDPLSVTRSFVLTEHVEDYQKYTVTLHAMLGETSWLSDTVRVMPTDKLVHLPLVMRSH